MRAGSNGLQRLQKDVGETGGEPVQARQGYQTATAGQTRLFTRLTLGCTDHGMRQPLTHRGLVAKVDGFALVEPVELPAQVEDAAVEIWKVVVRRRIFCGNELAFYQRTIS